MELKSAIEKRSSVRNYIKESVPTDDIKEMIRLGGCAPSVNNSQPWKFIAITNKEILKLMSDAVWAKIDGILPDDADESSKKAKSQVEWFSTFFGEAPVVIAVLSKPYEAIVDKALIDTTLTHDMLNAVRGYPDVQSIGASIQNILLAATDMGYGSCWLSGPMIAREEIEKIIGCNEPWKLAAMVSVGKANATPPPKEKKGFEEIFQIIE